MSEPARRQSRHRHPPALGNRRFGVGDPTTCVHCAGTRGIYYKVFIAAVRRYVGSCSLPACRAHLARLARAEGRGEQG